VTERGAAAVAAKGDELPRLEIHGVNADFMKIAALVLRDGNPIHFDTAVVKTAGLGTREVNQGAVTMAYVLNLLIDWGGSRSAVYDLKCRFKANVFAGDDVLVGGEVVRVADSEDGRLVECDIWVDGVDGIRVISGCASIRTSDQI